MWWCAFRVRAVCAHRACVHGRSKYFRTVSILIFWARFCNNALVIMLVNMESPGRNGNLETTYPATFTVLRAFNLMTGDHRDFTVQWFYDVGRYFFGCKYVQYIASTFF